ncbi:LuxR family transcriptional regulator [Phycicoccus sp. Soil748]|uniref:helix-turn-helix transcriptional regulator n=1 Tax=Phycicoccus sp. Soil748 TaxID=1736397 RepID=UPI00138F03B4|nr:LuxR family transcriptional regulator [Phycicoccus sp. Soil748]
MTSTLTGAQPVLFGRAQEFGDIAARMAGAADGTSRTLLVSGEPGVGKTALLREVTKHVSESAEVIWAACLPMSSFSVPLLPLASALQRRAAGVPAGPGGLDGSVGYAPVTFDAWLDERCRERPVMLVVDDLQWADESTLDVLLYVLAGPGDRRLLVVASLRDGEEGPLVTSWLCNVRRLPGVEELHVGRLDRLGVAGQLTSLLGRPPHQSLVDQVYERSRGNPYLTQLIARGLGQDATSLPAGLPHELREAATQHWHRLSPAAKVLIRMLALAGRPQGGLRLKEFASRVGVGQDIVPLLREAVDGAVLEVVLDGRYWFVHPLLAEVLEDSLLAEERQAIHAVLADAILADDSFEMRRDVDSVVAVADHHAGAERHEEAFRWALIAARTSGEAGGAAEELRLLWRALRLWPAVPDPGMTETEVLRRIQAAADRAGDVEAELEAVARLLVILDRVDEPLLTSELLVRSIDLEDELGRPSAGVERASDAVTLSAPYPDSPEHAIATAELAEKELWRGVPSGGERAERAVQLARHCGSATALARALVVRCTASVFAGGQGGLDDALAAMAAAAEARDFPVFANAAAWASNCIDIGAASLDATALLSRSRERLELLGAPHRYVAKLCAQEAYALLMLGRWQVCVERLRVALGSSPGPRADGIARLTASLLDTRQGRWDQAEAHLARVAELSGSRFEFFGYHAIRAELLIAQGDPLAGFEAAMAGVGVGHANLTEHLMPLAARALADEAQALRDQGEDPEPALARLRALRESHPTIVVVVGPGPAHAREIEAMTVLYDAEVDRAGNGQGTYDIWERAAGASADAGLAWDEAYCWWRAAESLLRSSSRHERARAALRRAFELSTALAAMPLVREVEALAHQCRVNLSAPSDIGPAVAAALPNLTPREREILALLVGGRTYAEIAHALFISEKTVSSHISHMLRKTGTNSRVELAQVARRVNARGD